jgi:integrase
MHPLSKEESRSLLAVVRGDRQEALYVRAMTTEMRLGELLGLKLADVDLHRPCQRCHHARHLQPHVAWHGQRSRRRDERRAGLKVRLRPYPLACGTEPRCRFG